jgi:hypothetical protein
VRTRKRDGAKEDAKKVIDLFHAFLRATAHFTFRIGVFLPVRQHMTIHIAQYVARNKIYVDLQATDFYLANSWEQSTSTRKKSV